MGNAKNFGLPLRVYLYTLDQIATMVQIQLTTLKSNYIHFEERSVGFRPLDRISARNIAPDGEKPEWRVTEEEFVRWLRYRGFKVYNRATVYR